MSENKKVFFIINKFSGGGYRPEVEGRIITACEELGMECTIEFTRSRGHATELARQAVEQHYPLVFAVGGDGTVNEVAQGLVDTPAAMGILPKGSGNGLARHLGIPMNFIDSLKIIGSGKRIAMDTVRVNNRLSVNVAGVGFDGHVAGLFGKDGKRGLVGYSRLVLKEFPSYPEFGTTLKIDGKEFPRKAFIIAFANSSQFGNNARIAPHASVCDEVIDVCIIRKVPAMQIVGFMAKMFAGSLNHSAFVEIIKARKIQLQFDRPMAFHIDGEGMEGQTDFEIEIKPGSLKMLIPEKVRAV